MSGEPQQKATAQRITVRQVTSIQASWTEEERGEEGRFTLQLMRPVRGSSAQRLWRGIVRPRVP
jgi:hypothetical protein